jgi:hypothetical protein
MRILLLLDKEVVPVDQKICRNWLARL